MDRWVLSCPGLIRMQYSRTVKRLWRLSEKFLCNFAMLLILWGSCCNPFLSFPRRRWFDWPCDRQVCAPAVISFYIFYPEHRRIKLGHLFSSAQAATCAVRRESKSFMTLLSSRLALSFTGCFQNFSIRWAMRVMFSAARLSR